MRATITGIIGMSLIMLVHYFINGKVDYEDPFYLIIYTLVFISCATSQLIKQAKEWFYGTT